MLDRPLELGVGAWYRLGWERWLASIEVLRRVGEVLHTGLPHTGCIGHQLAADGGSKLRIRAEIEQAVGGEEGGAIIEGRSKGSTADVVGEGQRAEIGSALFIDLNVLDSDSPIVEAGRKKVQRLFGGNGGGRGGRGGRGSSRRSGGCSGASHGYSRRHRDRDGSNPRICEGTHEGMSLKNAPAK
jgi:hypothetical protein